MTLRGCRARRRPRPTAAAPGAPARQQPPELLGLLPGAVNEGVNSLARHGAKLAPLAPPQPAGDLLGRPPFRQPLADEPAELGVTFEDGRALAPLEVAAFRVHRQVAALGQRVAPQLAADRRGRPAEPGRDPAQAQPLALERGQPLSLLQPKMRPARHRPIPDFGC
jgi:hypothetical protein